MLKFAFIDSSRLDLVTICEKDERLVGEGADFNSKCCFEGFYGYVEVDKGILTLDNVRYSYEKLRVKSFSINQSVCFNYYSSVGCENFVDSQIWCVREVLMARPRKKLVESSAVKSASVTCHVSAACNIELFTKE